MKHWSLMFYVNMGVNACPTSKRNTNTNHFSTTKHTPDSRWKTKTFKNNLKNSEDSNNSIYAYISCTILLFMY